MSDMVDLWVDRRSRFCSVPGELGRRTRSPGFAGGEVPKSQPITGIAFCCARMVRAAVIAAPSWQSMAATRRMAALGSFEESR